MEQTHHVQYVDIELLDPHPDNQEFFRDLTLQELNDFAQNIEEIGMKEPIVITPPVDGRHMICAGHQRVRAYKLLGRKQILAIVDPSLTDPKAVKKALLSTNFYTRNLSRQEIVRIVDELTEMKMSQREIAKKMGTSRNTVIAYQRLGSLAPRLKEMTVNFPRDLMLAIAGLDEAAQENLAEMLEKMNSRAEVSQLQKKLDDTNEELRDAVLTREAAKRQKRLLDQVLEKKEKRISELQTQIEEIEATQPESGEDFDPDQIEEYETQLSELRKELKQKTSESQDLQNIQAKSLERIQALETKLTNTQTEIQNQIQAAANERVAEQVEAVRQQMVAEAEQKTGEYQRTIQEMQEKLEELKNRPPEPPPAGERLEGYDLSLYQDLAALEGVAGVLLGKAIAIERKVDGRHRLPTGAISEVHLKSWNATTKKIAEIDDIMSQLAARKDRGNNVTAVSAKAAGGRG